jgi:hypothetical protein
MDDVVTIQVRGTERRHAIPRNQLVHIPYFDALLRFQSIATSTNTTTSSTVMVDLDGEAEALDLFFQSVAALDPASGRLPLLSVYVDVHWQTLLELALFTQFEALRERLEWWVILNVLHQSFRALPVFYRLASFALRHRDTLQNLNRCCQQTFKVIPMFPGIARTPQWTESVPTDLAEWAAQLLTMSDCMASPAQRSPDAAADRDAWLASEQGPKKRCIRRVVFNSEIKGLDRVILAPCTVPHPTIKFSLTLNTQSSGGGVDKVRFLSVEMISPVGQIVYVKGFIVAQMRTYPISSCLYYNTPGMPGSWRITADISNVLDLEGMSHGNTDSFVGLVVYLKMD